MRIKEILWQHRRDFTAIYECEHCGHTHKSKGYEDGCADRPQGEWVDVWQDGVCSWRGTCSNCRRTNDIPPPMLAKYCP